MTRVLVTGGDGLLAHALKQAKPQGMELHLLGHAGFDLTNRTQMAACLAEVEADVVINTAAYNLVDRCETERDLSWSVNATGPETLARLCAERNCRLIHYSTDYVFDGSKVAPYLETDQPNPLNHYAEGKLHGEQSVLKAAPQHLVLRTSWLFGAHPKQTKSYVHTVVKTALAQKELKATTDQVSVPTYAPDLARWTIGLINKHATGLFHTVNDEPVSRFDWTLSILSEALEAGVIKTAPPLQPVTTAFFNSSMKRPAYSALGNAKATETLGRNLGSWRNGLREMLRDWE